jgi:hypothetical protein
MSYLKSIDDYTSNELLQELGMRIKKAEKGRCSYCNKNLSSHTCKYAGMDPKENCMHTPVPDELLNYFLDYLSMSDTLYQEHKNAVQNGDADPISLMARSQFLDSERIYD